ncbi:MAG TPA: cupin domain-containing protein [Deltaproteobacteria bacterium]|nr:cupin domain-containing protein [Deltaproteobacteria bacterium]
MRIGLLMKDCSAYHELARGLTDLGHQVAALTKNYPLAPLDYHEIAQFMRAAHGYDIIHNCMGTAPVIFSPFVTTPMLCMLDEYLNADEAAVCRDAPAHCYFAADSRGHAIDGLRHLFILENGMDIMPMYLSAYKIILREHTREDQRPWGFYRVLLDQGDHKVKQITVWPGKRLSLQSHRRRAEHWVIVNGQARVTVNDRVSELCTREAVDIPPGAAHRIQNIGEGPLVFIEVQQGDYFGEDDIIRLEDDFGRA